jgi:hypothetical protein
MTTRTETSREVFVPIEDFWANIDGVDTLFKRDVTRVRAGHKILDKYGHLFRAQPVQYDVEQATDAPGERRG